MIIKKLINLVKPDLEFVSKSNLINFETKNKSYKLYKEGLYRSGQAWSNNFYKENRFLNLIQCVEHVLSQKKVYSFAECGCWYGHSSYIISSLIKNSKKKIKFNIFDSFDGLSNPTKKDSNFRKLGKKKGNFEIEKFSSSEKHLKNRVLQKFNFVNIYKGWIPTRFNEIECKQFSFVHIDVDMYDPTFKSLEFFFPRLVKGGIIVCDDYNLKNFDGATKAWNKYLSKKKIQFIYKNPLGGSFLIK